MFKHLFEPKKINGCEIPNRLVVAPMVTNYCTEDGDPTDRYIAYFEEKAKGGWGLIITDAFGVTKNAKNYVRMAGIWNDEKIPAFKKLVDTIHKYETKIFAQIYHSGRSSNSAVNGGAETIAPSAITCPWFRQIPRELTVPEIEALVTNFGDAALRVKKAGFDGVEIHGAHGYLLSQFLSPYSNKRTDEYGGCFENRFRFLREVYENVRGKVGKDFPVTVRLNATDGFVGGIDIAEVRVLSIVLEELGVDALHFSQGFYGDHVLDGGGVPTMYTRHAVLAPCAEEIKKLVRIPVITVNRINEPRMADSILEMGKADFVAMGRGSLADPHLPKKAKEGDLTSIRYCIGCLQGCVGYIGTRRNLTCLVNPSVGREFEIDYSKVSKPKKVFVAGGGPGGMEAARIAAIRGHNVVLFEKKDQLGGQFRSAAYPPGKGELTTYTAWLIRELKKLGVDIRCSTELTKETVQKEKPDTVIVATGGKPIVPPVKGIDKPHVVYAEDALLGKVTVGDNIVVAGGGEVGAETAVHLAMQQKNVAIVEMLPEILKEQNFGSIKLQLKSVLDEFEVKVHVNSKVVEITDTEVLVESPDGKSALKADTVVLAFGYVPDNKLVDSLRGLCENIIAIGGAVKTSDALAASREGFDAGLAV
ncbi:MAG: FAD-dependent oxidoreductase, partial [Treponema sp.]|jgi:2,4-dienoyl-CoA reductase-like NADH-dependent reductase (Old Yellow Enzyme family)/thioredoxin reductase|nr:FAD-dependent oxidoreductase [Treponema sp.]